MTEGCSRHARSGVNNQGGLMKLINSMAHGFIDYMTGMLLLVTPYIFGFADVGGAAVTVPRIIGLVIIAQSLFTRYELAFVKTIPFRTHLMLDYGIAALTLLSPWLFGFADIENARAAMMAIGVMEFLVVIMTRVETTV